MNTFGLQVGRLVMVEPTNEIGIITAFRNGATPSDPALVTVVINDDYEIYAPVNRVLPVYR